MTIKYEDLTFDQLGTRRQRPMMVSAFRQHRRSLDIKDYPDDINAFVGEFIEQTDDWIQSHKRISYKGLDQFPIRHAILGTTHQIDELHMLHGKNIVVFKGEYKYHRRLTDFKVKQIPLNGHEQLVPGDVFVMSYPSCITTGHHKHIDDLLEHCLVNDIPIHIDGAWFGQCRNFEFDVSHPAIKSVSVSLSKSLGLGSQRIGIRYTREKVLGPITIMNDFQFVNIGDMWLGSTMMTKFGPDFWWGNYEPQYTKVCKDFGLKESNSIHVGWHWDPDDNEYAQYGIRTPLRFLIDGFYDERGTDKGLNPIEKAERS